MDFSTVCRSPVLCDIAAEFIETRPQQALGVEIAGAVQGQAAQYVREKDRFMLKEDIEIESLYTDSRKKAGELKASLAAFSGKIYGPGASLKIDKKRLEEYNMDDVLSIVESIKKKHKEAEKVEDCSGAIRKFFRAASKHTGTLETLLGFAPDDIYGAVITGGLTMILGAMERAEKLRSDIYTAVADIPRQMMDVRERLRLYGKGMAPELHRRADMVFLAVFNVLLAIIEEITKSFGTRSISAAFKGKDHGKKIDDSLATLKSSIQEFLTHAESCLAERIRDIGETGLVHKEISSQNMDIGLENQRLELENQDIILQNKAISLTTQAAVVDGITNLRGDMKRLQQSAGDQGGLVIVNYIFKLFKGSPYVENGKLNMEQCHRRRKEDLYRRQERRDRENGETTGKWLASLPDAQRDAGADGQSIMAQVGVFEQTEQDKVQHLLMSEQLRIWIAAKGSMALIVESTTGPEVFSAVSFVSAFIHHSLCSADRASNPVLGFFGGCRALDDTGGTTRRPDGMLAALFTQLLEQVKSRDDVDMSGLGDPPSSLPTASPGDRIKLLGDGLKKLIGAVSGKCNIYVVLDSVWRMSGGDADRDEALKHVLDLVPWTETEGGGVRVKILATNFLSRAPYADHQQDNRFAFLDLPETVDSSGFVINPDNLDLINKAAGEGH
ncbi:hypothetical protein RB595_003888 [Gaeumannomyces hyphopodioides]